MDLSHYNLIVVNSSGGKDSQTALRYVVKLADEQGVNRSKIIVSHQCLGRMEWDGTLDLVKKHTDHYGLRLVVSSYRTKRHDHIDLLEAVRRRGKWPSSKQRYCTSEFKRGPGGRVLTLLRKESPGDILNVYGFRAEESASRAKRAPISINKRFSTKQWAVTDWLPIHQWTEAEVWKDIKESKVPFHHAYELGMPRLSCRFCIFAPMAALITAGIHNPDLLNEYCDVEAEIGHDFQHKKPIRLIRDAIAAGEKPGKMDGVWNM